MNKALDLQFKKINLREYTIPYEYIPIGHELGRSHRRTTAEAQE